MNDVKSQYEAYPYPERNPKDEKKRLIVGSPSHPLEMDHFVFGGKRDWSKPLKALVAGGGTGDALIQLAQVLTTAKRPYEITYIDLSTASRKIAEARAKVRGLKNITFLTGSLLDAPKYGPFDYIDCCGVLHHLPEPQAGFDALSQALAPEGGLGFMVYAPYGRSGVYPLQQAFGAALGGLSPTEKLRKAKEMFAALPEGHPFKCNPHLVDHNQSDAGFYDLLLHSQDRPYLVTELVDTLEKAGLSLSGFTQPALYDPALLLPKGVVAPTDPVEAMQLAEKLRGTLKLHVGYAVPSASKQSAQAKRGDMAQIPHLKGVNAKALAQQISKTGSLRITVEGAQQVLTIPKSAAGVLSLIDGRRSLAEIAKLLKQDQFAFSANWKAATSDLFDYGILLHSRLLK
ncbi:class I SAM-dependent methyltransferase [Cochlodiniinecator piscidefendens]|uniref:class I SAM-dependent methyltransferase n=1 Tax=Cochlodiniinecator piscidefendens TaxID=2715756 RepID=UPI0014091E97|nr:class I SAM-dependent methyltransferase [Cochlodiniinecator piscidefendens]